MNNKNYFIFAAAIALASCSVDEYMGENPEFTQTTKENIIGFGGGTGSMSRATSNEGPTNVMLDNQFKVYGWKTVSGTTQKVFDNYWVWYEGTNKTPSNPDATNSNAEKGWEYVGNKGDKFTLADNSTQSKGLPDNQYIKYWDYSATNYKFVAGSPIDKIDFNSSTSDENTIASATVKNLQGHINPNLSGTKIDSDPVYIAEPITISKSSTTSPKYGEAVKLKFTRLQTKVRVGIYETIPGYSIESITFYKQGTSGLEAESGDNSSNVILTSTTENYFTGGSNVKATVNYDWTTVPTAPTYSVTYSNGSETNATGAFETGKNWYGGLFASGIKATSSNPTGESAIANLYGSDNDMDKNTGYFTVLSTTATPSALVIKCDFTLTSLDGSGETINVTGATAAIPAAYCKWDENKMYTYIFKISQKTNGTTGTGSSDPDGLYPITFDAAATATEEGVETIVQTPSITTHQTDAAVTANGIEYKTDGPIDITVTDDSGNPKTDLQKETKDIQGYIAVYNLGATEAHAKTEAELTVTGPTVKAETGLNVTNDKATFTPTTAGYYAIQYCVTSANTSTTPATPAAYKYKVIYVNDSSSSGN